MAGSEHGQMPSTEFGGRAAARLDFDVDQSIRAVLDGAWWPRSRDTAEELVDLVAALDAKQVRVGLIMLNPNGWLGHPRRLRIGDRTVRVSWFRDLDTAVLIATTDNHRRVDLLVSIVDSEAHPALAALLAADDDEPSTEALLAALQHPVPKRTT
jgi:Family of unknown function (DUF5994)